MGLQRSWRRRNLSNFCIESLFQTDAPEVGSLCGATWAGQLWANRPQSVASHRLPTFHFLILMMPVKIYYQYFRLQGYV